MANVFKVYEHYNFNKNNIDLSINGVLATILMNTCKINANDLAVTIINSYIEIEKTSTPLSLRNKIKQFTGKNSPINAYLKNKDEIDKFAYVLEKENVLNPCNLDTILDKIKNIMNSKNDHIISMNQIVKI